VFLHRLGTPHAEDRLVYERPDDKELSFGIGVTEDGKFEEMRLSRGTSRNNRWYVRAFGTTDWKKVIDEEVFQYASIDNDGSVFYVLTTDGAPRRRLVAIDVDNPARENWQELIPQGEETLDSVRLVGDRFVAVYTRDAHNLLRLFRKDGSFDREVELPTIGSVGGISGRREHRDFYFNYTSFTYPSTILRHDLDSGKTETFFAPQVPFNPADFETTLSFARSRDGTRVPLFITHRKGLKLDGSNPALLSAYGGFGVGQGPSFSALRIAWLERGGVFAQASLRGGDEYGEAWHHAGRLEKKQNVFDDLHASAEHLAKLGYTSPAKLAIQGGSNGGLLVAACVLQRPELYGAAISAVPVIDMLRYHKLGIGRFWVPEYGNAEASSDQFAYLYAYSPLHNVKPGIKLPPILITTGEGDNRVVPAHSYKWAATLAANADPSNLLLMRVQSKAGHGGGKPTSKILDESADTFAFLMRAFGMN
jgi:prolyl oligopeptidase